MAAKLIFTAILTEQALTRFKPIEMLPVVGGFAGEIELLAGSAMVFGIVVKKVESEIATGFAAGMIASGLTKTLNKYFPKLSRA